MTDPNHDLRLNRFLARAGLGSRRAVEELIRAGRVSLDGEVVLDLGRRVDPAVDTVSVDRTEIHLPDDFRVYAFHKPHGVVSTLRSQGGQACLQPYRLRSELPERFVPVGRLDAETTGLLLWTDDGELNQSLCRPDSGIWKVYEVELDAPLALHQVPRLTGGRIQLDGRPCRPCELRPGQEQRKWVMELHEGRKRQVRRMFHAIGRKVIALHRVAVGPVKLELLHPGDFRRLNGREIAALREAVSGSGQAKPRRK